MKDLLYKLKVFSYKSLDLLLGLTPICMYMYIFWFTNLGYKHSVVALFTVATYVGVILKWFIPLKYKITSDWIIFLKAAQGMLVLALIILLLSSDAFYKEIYGLAINLLMVMNIIRIVADIIGSGNVE